MKTPLSSRLQRQSHGFQYGEALCAKTHSLVGLTLCAGMTMTTARGMVGVWTNPFKQEALRVFASFYDWPPEDARRRRGGIYGAHDFGPPGS